jgi:ribosomal protein L7Ae-like RNA K-turn-binding protein
MTALLRLLGLGYRARNVVVGVDAVRQELQRGELRCVVLANDASPRAVDKLVRLAEGKHVPLLEGPDAETLGVHLGKPPVMAVGIRDRALADGILRSAPESQ